MNKNRQACSVSVNCVTWNNWNPTWL